MQKGAIRHRIIGNVANTMQGVSKEPSELPSWYIMPPNGGPAMHPIPTTCTTKHSHLIQQLGYVSSSCSQRFMSAALFGVDGYCALWSWVVQPSQRLPSLCPSASGTRSATYCKQQNVLTTNRRFAETQITYRQLFRPGSPPSPSADGDRRTQLQPTAMSTPSIYSLMYAVGTYYRMVE